MDSSNAFIFENIDFYHSLKTKNPVDSYTVLATINLSRSNELIALASGTQANLKAHPDDIEDCHAESVLKRAYKRYLVDKLLNFMTKCDNLDSFKELVDRECEEELVLFVSQFPCGFNLRYKGDDPVEESTGERIKRKPGRGRNVEGQMVYVRRDPCFDKLKRWCSAGIQGRSLKEKFGLKSRVKRVYIGDCEAHEQFDYQSNLARFRLEVGSSTDVDVIRGIRADEFLFEPQKQPQPTSIAWWASPGGKEGEGGKAEYIVDGRKMGLTRKLLAKDLIHSKLEISNCRLRKDIEELERLHKNLLMKSKFS